MWPRVLELALGCWLMLSPLIFRGTDGVEMFAPGAAICGAAVIVVSLASFWNRLRRIHLANGAVALWLIAFGYFGSSRPGPPAAQNDIILGLLLLMLFVIPTEAHLPSKRWSQARADWKLQPRSR